MKPLRKFVSHVPLSGWVVVTHWPSSVQRRMWLSKLRSSGKSGSSGMIASAYSHVIADDVGRWLDLVTAGLFSSVGRPANRYAASLVSPLLIALSPFIECADEYAVAIA